MIIKDALAPKIPLQCVGGMTATDPLHDQSRGPQAECAIAMKARLAIAVERDHRPSGRVSNVMLPSGPAVVPRRIARSIGKVL